MDDSGFWLQQLVGWVLRTAILSLFLINLRRLLLAIKPENRAIRPNVVWLNVIPLFDLVWVFVTVVKIRDSVRAEQDARGWARTGAGYAAGLVSTTCYVVSQVGIVLLTLMGDYRLGYLIAQIGFVVAFVAWIVYWTMTIAVKNQFVGMSRRGSAVAASDVSGPNSSQALDEAGRAEGMSRLGASGASASSRELGFEGTVCTFCGADYRPGGKFCPSCGRQAV